MQRDLVEVHTKILRLLERRNYEPTEVAAILRPVYDDRTVREAVWQLLDAGYIDWNSARTLTLAVTFAG